MWGGGTNIELCGAVSDLQRCAEQRRVVLSGRGRLFRSHGGAAFALRRVTAVDGEEHVGLLQREPNQRHLRLHGAAAHLDTAGVVKLTLLQSPRPKERAPGTRRAARPRGSPSPPRQCSACHG